MLVVERDTQLACILADAIADAVVDIGHQVTLGDVQHLVEAVGDMEAQSVGVIHILQSACGADSVPAQPFAVGEGKLQFIAVFVYLFAAEDRGYLWQFDLSYSCQVIHYLLLLMAQLFLIGQDLPLASAALAIVLTHGLAAHR